MILTILFAPALLLASEGITLFRDSRMMSRLVLPRLTLPTLISLSRSNRLLHRLVDHEIDCRYRIESNNLYDLGELFDDFQVLDSQEDSCAIIDFVQLIRTQLKVQLFRCNSYLKRYALEYIECAFFTSEEMVGSDFVWCPEFRTFFNALFRHKRFRSPVPANPAMIAHSDIRLLSGHLEPIGKEQMMKILMVPVRADPSSWKYFLNKELYTVDELDPVTFCLLCRTIDEVNIEEHRDLIAAYTSQRAVDYSLYNYMILYHAPFSLVRYCFSKRRHRLDESFKQQAIVAIAAVGYDRRLYTYFRCTTIKQVHPFLEGKTKSICTECSAMDLMEVALMLGYGDDHLFAILERIDFVPDLHLILIAAYKKRSPSFIRRLLSTNNTFRFQDLHLPLPGGLEYTLPFPVSLDIATKLQFDQPELYYCYCILMLTESVEMLRWTIQQDKLFNSLVYRIFQMFPSEILLPLLPDLALVCIERLINPTLVGSIFIDETIKVCQELATKQSYLVLGKWAYQLSGAKWPMGSFLSILSQEIHRAITSFKL